MNLILTRTLFRQDGIFGTLTDESGKEIAATLEHAYDEGNSDESTWLPKTPIGTYTCKRGPHRLHGMVDYFSTYEVQNVPEHTNILFHWGNYNSDSDGCILLGRRIVANPDKMSDLMITSSKNTFNKFIDLQRETDTFTLTIKENR